MSVNTTQTDVNAKLDALSLVLVKTGSLYLSLKPKSKTLV